MTVLELAKTTPADSMQAGGKGAGLIRLLQLGMPVPRGLVITAATYTRHADRCGLYHRLRPLLENRDWMGVEHLAFEVLMAIPLDEQLTTALLQQYRNMGAAKVAVRSSATCEDQEEASSAGQYATYLNISGEEELLQAIRKCWASLWKRRAVLYRNRRAIDHRLCAMAVIVQEMVPATTSGVLFTIDPLHQKTDQLRIETVPGLGDGLVSGTMAGEVILVDRQPPGNMEKQEIPGSLSQIVIQELRRIALCLEEHLKLPQDIEFALTEENIHLLQTRPMTALTHLEIEPLEPLGKPSLLDKMIKPFADERYAIAPRPLDNIVVALLIDGHLHAVKECGGRFNEEDEQACKSQIWRQAYRLPPVHRFWAMVPRGLCLQIRQLHTDWLRWWEEEPGRELRAVSGPLHLASVDDLELFTRAERILAVWGRHLNRRMSAAGGIRMAALLHVMITLAVGLRKRTGVTADVMAGLETPTVKLNEDLWLLSRQARETEAVRSAVNSMNPEQLQASDEGRRFLVAFKQFIDQHGHREGSCWYLTTPTWGQDQSQVWRLLASLVEVETRTGSPAQATARHQASLSLVERRLRIIPGLASVFHQLWQNLYRLHAFRELSHYDLTRPLDALQKIAAEWGKRLVARGFLEREDDVGYLTYEEVRQWLCNGPPDKDEVDRLIEHRRATYRQVNAAWQAERLADAVAGKQCIGIGASPGIIRGRVRVIHGEHEFDKLLAGEILVSSYTNPAWTPLFLTAGAVVTETGGAASHAAIVAREYGIPAVMAIPGVTRILKDGQEILVDGSRGFVSWQEAPGRDAHGTGAKPLVD